MSKMSDYVIELKEKAHKELCEREQDKCEYCQDTGYVTKTEWSGTDDSYDVEVKCGCNED